MTAVQTLFLILWVAFYGAYVLKMLMLRRQGVRGDILGKGEKPKGRAALEMGIKIVTYLGAAIQLLSITFPAALHTLVASYAFKATGLLLAALGNVAFIAAVLVMGRNWRAGFSREQNTKLVTDGIYRISRNPAFLGFDLLYIGCALAFPNVLSIAFAVMAILLFHTQILGEEQFLVGVFGQAYLTYKGRTMRYLGSKRG